MQKRTLMLLGLSLPLLAGCGEVAGKLIPPQTIQNPANLNGATLVASSPLTIQKVGGSVAYDTSTALPPASFDDVTFPELPFGIRPGAVSIKAGFTKVLLTGACVAPDSFNLTLESFSVSVWNSGNKAGAATLSGTPNITAKATKVSSDASGTTYTLAANSVTVAGDLQVTGNAITILTSGGKNDVSASARISADQDSLAGCQLTFTLGDTSATFSNFQ